MTDGSTAHTDDQAHVDGCELCQQKRLFAPGSEPTGELRPEGVDLTPTLKRGSLIGRYVVLEVLGAGGMGEVYTAIDPELDRRVALKLVRSDASRSAAERQTRLLREAQAMAKLSHPNVVSIFDVGVVDGRVFLAMELVTGSTLTAWLAASPRTWREVLEIFKQAGTGLSAAHRAGMIHRDFKPDNILIGHDGRVRVSDFGLARAATSTEQPVVEPLVAEGDPTAESSSNLLGTPMTQGILGTPGYMAPEQLLGTNTDEKSDQFSFCVSLYRALYAGAPFKPGPMHATLAAITAGEVRPAPEGTAVPMWVRKIVVKGLSAAPSGRYGSIDELTSALGDDPVKRRNRLLVFGAAALLIAGLIASAVVIVRHQSQRCSGADEALAGLWDDSVRSSVHLAFGASALPYRDEAFSAVKAQLDQYASAWVRQKTEACEATWVRGDQSNAMLGLRTRCLADRAEALRALTGVLTHVDAAGVEALSRRAQLLPGLDQCADAAALERAPATPPADAMSARLHQAAALLLIGQSHEALPKLEAIDAELKTLAAPSLRAHGLLLLINARLAEGQREGVRALVLEQIHQSELAFNDSLRFQGLLLLAGESSTFDEVLTYGRVAAAALARVSDVDWHQVQLQRLLGRQALAHRTLTDALVAFERGLEHAHHDRDRYELTRGLADTSAAMGHFTRSLQEHAAARDLLVASLGPHHPDLADDFEATGELQAKAGRPREAVVSFEAAERIDRENHRPTVEAEIATADAMRGMGRISDASTRLLALETAATGSQRYQLAMARLRLAQNQPQDAVTRLQNQTAPEALVVLAQALRKTNHLPEAITALESALKTLDDPMLRSEAHFEQAQATAALKQPPAQARALAEQAIADLQNVEGPALERIDAINAWLTTHPP